MRGALRRRAGLLLAAGALLGALLGVLRWHPGLALLWPLPGGGWLRHPEPWSLLMVPPGWYGAEYRLRFDASEPAEALRLRLYPMRDSEAFLDGLRLSRRAADLRAWKRGRPLELPPGLSPGQHELLIRVVNQDGPPVLGLSGLPPPLGPRSGRWEARLHGTEWVPARPADSPVLPPLSASLPSPAQALRSRWALHAASFAGAFLLAWALGSRRLSRLAPADGPGALRWLLLAAWGLLALNNLVQLPTEMGFDARGHLDYIRRIAQTGRLPLADEGWQTFQSPLYYLLSAPFYRLWADQLDAGRLVMALRFLPMACGALQVEVCLRALRLAYPRRGDLQALGLLVGGLLPMNLYLCQSLGNEPLTAVLSGAALLCGLRLLAAGGGAMALGEAGAVLGLALLSKMTALLLVPPLAWAAARSRGGAGRLAGPWARAGLLLGAAVLVCGWYYGRNWLEFGRPFVGNWDAVRGRPLWQDPGYRALGDYLRFGAALSTPVYSAFAGFWDALYSTAWLDGDLSGASRLGPAAPPWDYPLMVGGAWLALIPQALIAAGFVRACRGGGRTLRWAAACACLYLGALLAYSLALPLYSTVKATYLSGLTLCAALFAASGLEALPRGRAWTAGAAGLLGTWAVSAYLAYFAR